ncbi:MAG TPA: DUF4105 domain-containing protein [Gemmatimonadaceae bacterium]|nr:DUF4105 domain-containing protein [Gemmatimonadaceae bacterium]
MVLRGLSGVFVGLCLLAAGPSRGSSQIIPFVPLAPAGEPGSELTVYLLTIGQGDEVWELFGHNAIWIKDRSDGSDITYNWGMFDFAQPNFVGRFLTGNTLYWMEGIDLEAMLQAYTRRNRSLLAQELNLTPAQRLSLKHALEENARPENKFYRYDYYRDNCSTRLRDMLDRALGGQLQTATTTRITSETYRSHTQRLTRGNLPVYAGITLALGHPADRPISRWEEMFLPVRMANHLRAVRVTDTLDARVPLVRSEMALFTAGRAPEPAAPPNYLPWFVALGIAIGGALIALVSQAEGGGRLALFGATIIATLWSLVAGIAGTALVAAWAFTRHHFMSWNENLLQLSPLSLGLVVLIPLSVYRLRGVARARQLSAIVAALSLFGLIAQGVPFFRQLNGEMIALGLPINLAVVWTVYRLTGYRRTSRPSSAAL